MCGAVYSEYMQLKSVKYIAVRNNYLPLTSLLGFGIHITRYSRAETNFLKMNGNKKVFIKEGIGVYLTKVPR